MRKIDILKNWIYSIVIFSITSPYSGEVFFVFFLVVIQQETIAKFAVVEEKPYIRSLKNP